MNARESHTRDGLFSFPFQTSCLWYQSVLYQHSSNVMLLSCQCVTACEDTTKETVSGLCDEYYLFKLLTSFISCIHANFILIAYLWVGSVSWYKDEHLPKFRLLKDTWELQSKLYIGVVYIFLFIFSSAFDMLEASHPQQTWFSLLLGFVVWFQLRF